MSNYRIRWGDTLSGIAARYHTSVGALARANHIANPNLIYAGSTLRIPGHSGSSSFQPSRPSGSRGNGGTSAPSHTHGPGSSAPTSGPTDVNGIKVTSTMRQLAAAGHDAAMSMGG